jgi:putative protein-disulfide isomerase
MLGGLAPDSEAPMPETTRDYVQANWRRILETVPGTRFNFDFWRLCQPRRSTYPACRAVIAAMEQDASHEEPMILAIQEAYYLNARNPSDDSTLIDLARSLGLDAKRFAVDLNSEGSRAELSRQIAFSQRIGAQGMPSLILEAGGNYRCLPREYHDPAVVLEAVHAIAATPP